MPFAPEVFHLAPDRLRQLKADRRYLELALEEAGQLLGRPTRFDGTGCRCPFHNDENPSGSLHEDFGRDGNRTWLFTCHACPDRGDEWNRQNPDRPSNSGDAIAVLRSAAKRAGRDMTFNEACGLLLDAFAKRHGLTPLAPGNQQQLSTPPGPSASEVEQTRQQAEQAHQTLINSGELVDRLWAERAIDRDTAARFKVGYVDEPFGRAWWLFPISKADGSFMAQKLHAADGGTPKCKWDPAGAKRGDPLFPVEVEPIGPVFVCPGELKALGVISLGLPAIGITCGETPRRIPADAVALLQGRRVALVPDNDDTGRKWADAVVAQLQSAGIEVLVVDLGLTGEGEDVGDWLVERRVGRQLDAVAVRAELLAAFEAATGGYPDPVLATEPPPPDDGAAPRSGETAGWFRSRGDIWADETTWRPVVRIKSGIEPLDNILGGGFRTGAVHFIVGKAGNAKTQLASQIASGSVRLGVHVGFVSLEMGDAELGRLMLAQASGVSRSLLDGDLRSLAGTDAGQAVTQAARNHCDAHLDIVAPTNLEGRFSRARLAEVVARGVMERDWRMVIVDHLGELAPTDDDVLSQPLLIDKRNATTLRAIARKHDIALLVVAPLRKAANFKKVKKDVFALDDVLGSAALGYSVHTCLAVAAKSQAPSTRGDILIQVLKNRNGPTPDEAIHLAWHPASGRISGEEPGAPHP